MSNLQPNPSDRDYQAQVRRVESPHEMQAGKATVLSADHVAMARGATWFYYIAGLSLVNSVMILTGMNMSFLAGLGITQIFDGLGSQFEMMGKVMALVLDLFPLAFFALFGFFAGKGHAWAFITGMVFYVLDALILLVVQDWLALAFHGYVMFRLFGGLMASLNQAKK